MTRITIIVVEKMARYDLSADSSVCVQANAHLIRTPPAIDCLNNSDGWQNKYINKLDSGYIVALPYMSGDRRNVIQSILESVAEDNTQHLPIVMMALSFFTFHTYKKMHFLSP